MFEKFSQEIVRLPFVRMGGTSSSTKRKISTVRTIGSQLTWLFCRIHLVPSRTPLVASKKRRELTTQCHRPNTIQTIRVWFTDNPKTTDRGHEGNLPRVRTERSLMTVGILAVYDSWRRAYPGYNPDSNFLQTIQSTKMKMETPPIESITQACSQSGGNSRLINNMVPAVVHQQVPSLGRHHDSL